MIYTEQTKKAMTIMFEKHKDQIDKSGIPYVFHPWHVAESMKSEDEVVVALLHDVVEDTDTTLQDLSNAGFNMNVIEALSLLTHDKNVDYFSYVETLSKNPIARNVKLADLKHNSDLTRLNSVSEKDILRVEKYKKCIEFLSSCNDLENSKKR